MFGNNLTGNTYEAFLRNELPGLLEDIPLMIRSQMYFQHDGALPHYTNRVRELLNAIEMHHHLLEFCRCILQLRPSPELVLLSLF